MQIISTMTPQSAAEYLRARGMSISPDTLRRGIEQGVYPFGLCIKTDERRLPDFQAPAGRVDRGKGR